MIYSKFQDKALSLLGFGTMRFPLLADGSIDEAAIDMDGDGKADIVTPIECTEADFEPCCEEEECCCEKEAE